MSAKYFLIVYFALLIPKYVTSENNWTNLTTECILPNPCRFQRVNTIIDASGIEKMLARDKLGLKCSIFDGFQFDFNMSQQCLFKGDPNDGIIELRWPQSETSILKSTINMTNLFEFIAKFYFQFSLNLVNNNRFGLNIFDFGLIGWTVNIDRFLCTNCKFQFLSEEQKKLLDTCDDFTKMNLTTTDIRSIFQIYKVKYVIHPFFIFFSRDYINFTIINGRFENPLCPIVFGNSMIQIFQLIGLVDSFYKRNFLSFSNHSFHNMNSHVTRLQLDKVENINLDLKFLHPEVFKEIESIYIYGSINKIDDQLFRIFKSLSLISFKTNYFRKIVHKNGIKWMKSINSNLSVNVTNTLEIERSVNHLKFINMDCFYYSQEDRMSLVFPDEDFCLYIDYPFQQLVVLIQLCGDSVINYIIPDFSCTYLWLIQYYPIYYKAFNINGSKEINSLNNLYRELKSQQFNSKECNFKLMKSLCDKKGYKVREIWGLYDYSITNKKFEIGIKIASYVISLLGIITNLMVIVTISHKTNNEIFKGLKQYDYQCYNSVFSMLILVIQMLSWMSECFYPYEVFCPEIRKLVFIQVFKMVFKECFVTAFRFMWNFTYVAFALNRISLIGKDHGKLVKFVSEVGVKSYIIVTLFISCGFSVVKYFKYEINYDQPETSYPISNDHDLSSIHRTHISNDGVIIGNSIFDILNYVVFEVIIFIIDIYLIILLKRTLNEKLVNIEALICKKKLENQKQENDDAISKVIKMVILNTAISVLFRLPIAFIPVVNVFAEFYYKNYLNQFIHPKFGEFYSFLLNSGFYDCILECSDLLCNFSLFIQFFIYRNFDRLFKTGLDRLLVKNKYQNSEKS